MIPNGPFRVDVFEKQTLDGIEFHCVPANDGQRVIILHDDYRKMVTTLRELAAPIIEFYQNEWEDRGK